MRVPPSTKRRLVTYGTLLACLAAPLAVNWWTPRRKTHLKWFFETGGEFYCSPVVVGERVYFASADQVLRCMHWPSREITWSVSLPQAPRATPVFDPDTESLFLSTRGGDLLAVSAETGEIRWSRAVPTVRFRGGPVCGEEMVYLGGPDAWVCALDKRSGEVCWQRFVGASVTRPAALAEGVLYVGLGSGHLLALNAVDGEELWRFAAGGPINATATVDGGMIFFGSKDKHLYALDAVSGVELWRTRTFHEITARPAVAGERVVVGSWDHHLVCVERETGQLLWRFFARDVIENGPLIVDDMVYVGSWTGAVHGVDLETGEERWRFQTGTWVTASPVLSPDGESVLAASEDGTLYALAL